MKSVGVLFPHQLFKKHELLENCDQVYLVEEELFFCQYAFHKQKLAYHRASMKYFEHQLKKEEVKIEYVESAEPISKVRELIKHIAETGAKELHIIDPTDDWLAKRIKKELENTDLKLVEYENPQFLNSREDLKDFFREDKKSFFQTSFYKQQREKHNILLDGNGEPQGGKWSFDKENRKKFPKNKQAPSIHFPKGDKHWKEAVEYVEENFGDHPGELNKHPNYPYTHADAVDWLNQFLENRFQEFGDYEDAIVKEEMILHHSVLSPMLNIGLLLPGQVLDAILDYAKKNEIALNNTEGLVRQIMGWREFIRGMYIAKGAFGRTKNFWGFERKIPDSWYDGTTGIPPVDSTIKKVLKTGYCHHIERLMVLGNFMLLCEFHPNEVYRWFMELFIDAYDWVMVPNVYGMSQFADGGTFATKPYISGSNYILKMSNYSKGDWQDTWDGLFWRFMHVHRDFFEGNPRLGMLVANLDKMGKEKLDKHIQNAEEFLDKL